MPRQAAPDWGDAIKNSKTHEPKAPAPFHVHRLADVQPEEIRWLWYPYIPAGKLSSIEGDPGLGKSWITCAIATAIANGLALPGQRHPMRPQKVLMASAEDGLADTVVPRLQAFDADLDNIFAIEDNFTLNRQGIDTLEETMKEFAAAIVFIDPLVAYLGGKVDINRANEVRDVMKQMARAAENTGAAVVTVRHLRKGSGGKSIYRGLGSIDFTAASRSVLYVEQSPEGLKLVRHIKCNYAPKGKAIAYSLTEGEPIPGTDRYTIGEFKWGEFTDDPEQVEISTRPRALVKAQEFLHDLLRPGRVESTEVYDAAMKAGISLSTLNRAKKGLALSVKDGDNWYWELVGAEGTEGEQPKV